MPRFRKVLKWGSIVVLLGVSSCALSTGRSKAFLNPIMRPILLDDAGWKNFIDLDMKSLSDGTSKTKVERYLKRHGFKKSNYTLHQSKLCQWLGSGIDVVKVHLNHALESCRDAKMDFERNYSNAYKWSDENGKPINAIVVEDVYHSRHSEFPCKMSYAVYTFYDANNKLVDVLGYKHEAGCL